MSNPLNHRRRHKYVHPEIPTYEDSYEGYIPASDVAMRIREKQLLRNGIVKRVLGHPSPALDKFKKTINAWEASE